MKPAIDEAVDKAINAEFDEALEDCKEILSLLPPNNIRKSMAILATTMEFLVIRDHRRNFAKSQQMEPNPAFFDRKKRSRIDRDPEIKNYILSIDRYYTLDALAHLIKERFGADKAISKSTLQRFTAQIAQNLKNCQAVKP
jgi:hypothetical protein